jgi:hypothetical protein
MMSEAEQAGYGSLLRQARIVAEFGMGGSTTMALGTPSVRHVYSVESDPDWVRAVTEDETVRAGVDAGRATLVHADVGPVKRWGRPKHASSGLLWPRYVLAMPPSYLAKADLLLVDGRFRVACAIFSGAAMRAGSVICVHDYAKRPFYHVLAQDLRLLEVVDTLAIFENVPIPAERHAFYLSYLLQAD